MADLSQLSDDDLLGAIQSAGGQRQPGVRESGTPSQDGQFSGISDQDLLNEIKIKTSKANEIFTESQFPAEQTQSNKGALTFTERVLFNLGDERGQENFLRNKFNIVERTPEGGYMVGDSANALNPVDPAGFWNDFLGEMADLSGDIPSIAGMVLGSIAGGLSGTALAPGPGTVAGLGAGKVIGGGLGSAIGEKLRQLVAKGAGMNQQTAEEATTDVILAGAFGALGEGLALGMKAVAGRVFSKRASKMLDSVVKSKSGVSVIDPVTGAVINEPTKSSQRLAKLFNISAGVKEESTIDAAKHGFQKTFSERNLRKNTVVPIVRNIEAALKEGTETLSTTLQGAVKNLESVARRSGSDARIPVQDLFSGVKRQMQDLGLLDSFGKVNKNFQTALPTDAATLKSVLRLLGDSSGRGAQEVFRIIPGKTITVKQSLRISRAFGQKFSKMTGDGQAILFDMLNGGSVGGKATTGLRSRITELASKLGVEDFAKANEQYSTFLGFKERLGGLTSNNPAEVEAFVKGLENLGVFQRADLEALQAMTKTRFLPEWEMWNAAQDFTSANPNILRLTAIAGMAGFSFGGGDIGARFGRLGAGVLLGSPAGLRFLLTKGEKFISPTARRVAGRKIGQVAKKATGSKVAQESMAALSRLLPREQTN